MSNRKKRRVNIQQSAILILVLVLAAFFWLRASDKIDHQKLTVAKFLAQDDSSPSEEIYIEISEQAEDLARGLMYRQSLPNNQGMLFKFPEEKIHSMWMKNTFVSLDLIFMDSNYKILGMIENVPILNETPRKIDQPSKYVLELASGTVKRLALKVGDRLQIFSAK